MPYSLRPAGFCSRMLAKCIPARSSRVSSPLLYKVHLASSPFSLRLDYIIVNYQIELFRRPRCHVFRLTHSYITDCCVSARLNKLTKRIKLNYSVLRRNMLRTHSPSKRPKCIYTVERWTSLYLFAVPLYTIASTISYRRPICPSKAHLQRTGQPSMAPKMGK